MKKSSGNMSSTIKNVYLRLRSERRNWSSQLVPQNSLSIEIGLEHTAQCLCFGIEIFGSVFIYFDIIGCVSNATNKLFRPVGGCYFAS